MSRSTSSVSVITVNWNGKSHLACLLPSLLDLNPGEVIVVDNGSSDGSQAFVRSKYPGIRLLENPVNQGFAQPCNLGAKESKGTYLAFINNDMRPGSNWLTAALDKMDQETACVASRILDWKGEHIDYNGSSLHYLGYGLQQDLGKLVKEVSHEDEVLFACGGAMLVDRKIFLDLGGFDPDFFALFEDVDLGWRLWLSGHRVALVPESVVYHRGHATFEKQAPEKTRYLMHRNALLTIIKNYQEENFRRILPLAILLSVKRAVLFSGVQRESFYLWSHTHNNLGNHPRSQHLITDALNQLVALDDVLQALPGLLQKRRHIQALRQRTDHEIIRLFGDPLRRIVEDPTYIKEELELLELLDLGTLMDLSHSSSALDSIPTILRDKIRNLEKELKALQWLGSQASLHPPRPPGLIARYLQILRHQGVKAACRQVFEYINRAI